MRILAMVHAYPPLHNAGAELTLKAQLEHLAALGHEVDVLLSRPGPREPYTLAGVRVWPHVNNGDPFRWFGTDRQPQVVLTHLENTPRASVLGQMHKVPVVHLLHNTHDWTKHCLRRGPVALAVFNTRWMAKDYEAWFTARDLTLPRAIIMHPPVHAADYVTPADKRKHITLINLNAEKGGELFWELARRLPHRAFLGVKGAYGEQVIVKDFRSDEAYDHVTVAPHVKPTQMRGIYSETRVLLMPSSYESYGRCAIEAACSGIPTIAHPTPGLREALGSAGIFCDREDPDAWVAALRRLWTPKGYAKASVQAQELGLVRNYEATDDLDRFANALEGVVSRGPLAAVG